MAVKWGLLINKSLSFCWKPKRWLPFFITDLVFSLLAVTYILYHIDTFLNMLTIISTGNTAYLPHFYIFLIPIMLMGIACVLVNIWIRGALIHQSWKEKEFSKSFRVSLRAYPSMLAALIVTGILVYLVGLSYVQTMTSAAYMGNLFTFIASAALYFPLQIIIVKRKGVWDSLVGSWQLFRDQARNKLITRRNVLSLILISEIISMPALFLQLYSSIPTMVIFWIFCWFLIFAFLFLLTFSRVCDAMVLTTVISLLIVLLFSIPFILMFYNILLIVHATSSLGAGALALMGMKSIIGESILPLASSGIILLIGLAISKAFSLKAQTEFYLSFRKRILGIF